MGKSIAIVFFIVVAGLLGALVWINTSVPAADQAEADRILALRRQDWDLRQRVYANDAACNAYLDPTFKEMWWGEAPTYGATNATLSEFVELSPGVGVTRLNPRQLELRKNAQRLLLKLTEVIARPAFLVPSPILSYATPVPNVVGLCKLAKALSLESALEAQENRPDGGAARALDILRLSALAAGACPTINNFSMSIAIQSIGCDALVERLRQNDLKKATLERIMADMERCAPSQDVLGALMEYELLRAHNSMSAGTQTGPAVWSGWTKREMRIYDNQMLPCIRASYAKEFTDGEESKRLVSSVPIPDYSRARAVLCFSRTRARGLQLMAALQLYRLEKKRFPGSLEQLKQVGFTSPALNELSSAPFSYSLKDGKPELKIPVDGEMAKRVGLGQQRVTPYRDGFIQLLSP